MIKIDVYKSLDCRPTHSVEGVIESLLFFGHEVSATNGCTSGNACIAVDQTVTALSALIDELEALVEVFSDIGLRCVQDVQLLVVIVVLEGVLHAIGQIENVCDLKGV